MGRFFENERDASAPGFDEVDSAEQVGDEGIATAGDFGGFEGAQGDAFHESAGIADLDTVGEDGDADFVGIPVVAGQKALIMASRKASGSISGTSTRVRPWSFMPMRMFLRMYFSASSMRERMSPWKSCWSMRVAVVEVAKTAQRGD